MIFSIVAVSILFAFCFRPNIFRSMILNLLLPLGAEGVEAMNLDIACFSLLLLVAFVLKHNADEKICIDVRIHVKLQLQETGW